MATFAEWLQEQFDREPGVKAKDIAGAVGVTPGYLSALRSGRRNERPTGKRAEEIAGAFARVWGLSRDEANELAREAVEIAEAEIDVPASGAKSNRVIFKRGSFLWSEMFFDHGNEFAIVCRRLDGVLKENATQFADALALGKRLDFVVPDPTDEFLVRAMALQDDKIRVHINETITRIQELRTMRGIDKSQCTAATSTRLFSCDYLLAPRRRIMICNYETHPTLGARAPILLGLPGDPLYAFGESEVEQLVADVKPLDLDSWSPAADNQPW